MTRILLLTTDGHVPDEVLETVAQRAAAGPVEVRLILPLHPVPDAWTWDEDETQNEMLARLDEAMDRLRQTGAVVDGTIGCDRDAMVCVNFAMERESFDEVIVSMPRSGRARFLRMDLAARIARAFGLPVTGVTAPGRTPATA